MVVIGLLVDESVNDNYVTRKPYYKAKNIIILMWMVIGFLITSAYKSVLLSTLVSIEYEKPIDTIDDLLQTEKPIFVDETILLLTANDPKDSIQELRKKVNTHDVSGGNLSDTLEDR